MITDTVENALLTALVGLFLSIIAFYLGRNRVKNAVLGMINDYIIDFLSKIKANPQIASAILKPIVDELLKQYKGGGKAGIDPSVLAGGGIEALIPLLPRKWQGIAAIGSLFLKNDRKGQSQGSKGGSWD